MIKKSSALSNHRHTPKLFVNILLQRDRVCISKPGINAEMIPLVTSRPASTGIFSANQFLLTMPWKRMTAFFEKHTVSSFFKEYLLRNFFEKTVRLYLFSDFEQRIFGLLTKINFSTRLSNLHSTCLEEHFRDFFGKNYDFIIIFGLSKKFSNFG